MALTFYDELRLSHKHPMSEEEEIKEMKKRINRTAMTLEDDIYEKSTITKYFKGKCVFLTGAAGFLGQVYLEKLLR